MRNLDYTCKGQKLTAASGCDFSNIIKGSKGYLQVRISFDSDWSNVIKAAEFWIPGRETVYPILIKSGVCMIPDEVTDAKRICFRVIGKRGDTKVITNKVLIRQEG